jgi:anionic cell wall polymer biosynthesis LytR-Cps2A-Psr (LCP) family protein
VSEEQPAASGEGAAQPAPEGGEQAERVRVRQRVRIDPPGKKKRRRWYRNPFLLVPLVLVLLVLGYVVYLNAQLSGIRRAPLLADYTGAPGSGTNVLLIGSDSADGSLTADPDTLVVQLVHLSADFRQAAVVNVPRDMWLPQPGTNGAGSWTLLDSYRVGGVREVVDTLQLDLGLTVDHAVQISFSAYRRVTDRVGGVDLPTADGPRHFTGAQALSYADAPDLPQGTIDTGHRHQAWLKAMLGEALTPGSVLNPLRLVGLLHDTTSRTVVDDTFTTGAMRSLAWHARHLRSDSIRYLTAPYRGFGSRSGRRVLLPDAQPFAQLGVALRTDNQSAIASFDN